MPKKSPKTELLQLLHSYPEADQVKLLLIALLRRERRFAAARARATGFQHWESNTVARWTLSKRERHKNREAGTWHYHASELIRLVDAHPDDAIAAMATIEKSLRSKAEVAAASITYAEVVRMRARLKTAV